MPCIGASVHIFRRSPSPNSVPAASVRETVRKEVDARRATISGLLQEIAQLHTVHNTVAPINSLPPELLYIIFSYVSYSSRRNNNLLTTTHVCTLWRDVTLHAPALWTNIALQHRAGLKAFVERSKTLPLRVSYSVTRLVPKLFSPYSPRAIMATLKSIGENLDRTISLSIRVPGQLGDMVTDSVDRVHQYSRTERYEGELERRN
ncbi:hypothetical protein OH77DRAFT_1103071 [Trametes cingulata]|nr:hypothetical protein OH77DRAFT_1103071 [Trametes cingulata]